ncbi:hypothetical protein [Pseudomonas sp. Sample_22]|uniref:hypothetical protein n=1 Tax=Pseudomonas sp. Sample_22 TaxID=2448266 RepID=UPI001032E595|nr:hypothetical protein [Pseudomonas sp. Sample_22]
MTRQEYFYECARLSAVMGEKSDAIEAFKTRSPDLLDDSIFEEFDALQKELAVAIGAWQSFCDTYKSQIPRQ